MSRIRLPSFSNSAFSSINTYYKCDSTKEGHLSAPLSVWDLSVCMSLSARGML